MKDRRVVDTAPMVDGGHADAGPVRKGDSTRPGSSLEAQVQAATRARELGDTLFEIERHLSTAQDLADVVGLTLGLAGDVLGVCCGSIERRELGGWVTTHTWGASLARVGVFHSDTESPMLAEMKHAGRAITLQSDAGSSGAQCGNGANVGARVIVPLTSRGRVVGAITFCFPEPVIPSAEEIEFADRFATLLSIWDANCATLRRHRRLAEAFQRALINAPLTLQDLEIGHIYAPAMDEETAGGDFYDVFPMDGGRVAVSVGDVAGRGTEAASMTALVRDAIRVAALDGLEPPDVLAKTNRVLVAFFPPEMFATVLFGIIDPHSGAMTYALGGGPPPMHLDATRNVTPLGHYGPLLGALDDVEFEAQHLVLAPGEQVVFFTNGISEARRGDDMLDTAGVAQILRDAQRRDCRGLARELYEGAVRFAGEALCDDAAVLVIALKEPT